MIDSVDPQGLLVHYWGPWATTLWLPRTEVYMYQRSANPRHFRRAVEMVLTSLTGRNLTLRRAYLGVVEVDVDLCTYCANNTGYSFSVENVGIVSHFQSFTFRPCLALDNSLWTYPIATVLEFSVCRGEKGSSIHTSLKFGWITLRPTLNYEAVLQPCKEPTYILASFVCNVKP